MILTFLYGTDRDYKPSKTYGLEQGEVKKTDDYNLGYTFYFNSFVHAEDLPTISQTLKNFADKGWFRINGAPNDSLLAAPHTPVRRLSENFPEVSTRFTSYDIDGYPIPPDVAAQIGWSLNDPESTASVIRWVLSSLKLYSLACSDFVFLLTSSQFDRTKLNCHLYFLFEVPKSLAEMRNIIIGINTFYGTKVLDHAPYNPVQPDYIAAPNCVGFKNPIDKENRIHYSQSLYSLVPEDLHRTELRTITPPKWATSGLVSQIADNWLDTIKLYVGGDRGINEPAFRAAAQLVHEVGKERVIHNIDHYARMLHEEAWKAMMEKGHRGDLKDQNTYNVARFRQYLESATRTGKTFGEEVDSLESEVNNAIEHAKLGSIDLLYQRPMVEKYKRLRDKYAATWIKVKARIARELRGIIKISDINELIAKATNLVPISNTNQLEQVEALSGTENDMIRPILDRYRFVSDQNDMLYLIPMGDCKDLIEVNNDLINTFYRDGLMLSANKVSHMFGKKCMSVLMADFRNPTMLHTEIDKKMVGMRTLSMGQSFEDGLWYNAGVQPDKTHRVVELSAKELIVQENPTTPVWKRVPPNILPTAEIYKKKFPNVDEVNPDMLIDYYKKNITQYINCDTDDITPLTSWLVTAMSCKPLAYIGEFIGPHNCGKSTGADLAKDLIDPSGRSLSSGSERSVFTGNTDENFFALIDEQQVTILDNIGILKAQVQDVLCQISTGMRYNTRILYTHSQMSRYIQKPIILTGLARSITRPDLSSRAMVVNFSSMPVFRQGFIKEWYEDKPLFFGAILHIIQRSMAMIAGNKSFNAKGVSQRDIIYSSVSAVLSGMSSIDVQSVIHLRQGKYVEEVGASAFLSSLIAYFQQVHSREMVVRMTYAELKKDLEGFCYSFAGREVAIRLFADTGIVIDEKFITILGRKSETMNSFNWAFNKAIHAFESVSSWKIVDKKRAGRGTTLTFERKKVLTDLY